MEQWTWGDACEEWEIRPLSSSSDDGDEDDAPAPFCDKYRNLAGPLHGKLRRDETLTEGDRQLLMRVLRDVINHMTPAALPAERRPLPSPRSTLDDPD
jgi:hypothetical protein